MKGIPISIKIFGVSAVILIVSIIAMSITSFHSSQTIFENLEKERLFMIRDVKKNQIERLYKNHFFAISSLSKLPDVQKLYNILKDIYAKNDSSITKDSLRSLYKEYGSPIDRFVRKQSYSNLYLINNTNSQVLYSIKRGDGIGTVLNETEKYILLKEAWNKVLSERKIIITEFFPGIDNNRQLFCYLACPIISESGNNIASMVIEVPYSTLNDIVKDYTGLGHTGELILLSNDSLVRNNLRYSDTAAYKLLLLPENYISSHRSQTKKIVDYRDQKVILVSTNIDIPSLKWYLVVKIDIDEVISTQKSLKERLIFISIVILILMSLTLVLISHTITKPIRILNSNMKLLKQGILSKEIPEPIWNDEVSEIVESFNIHVKDLSKITNIANQISSGNIDLEFEEFGEKDETGNALSKLSKNIQEARKEEERRKIEDEHRSWAAQGIAKFTALLHQDKEDINDLGYSVIENLVNYVGANQGGLFLLMTDDEDKPFFEMVGSYAYNRRKFIEKKINIKEGYIGACYLEKETIFMTDIPDNYIDITSGLGNDNPKCLILIPLKSNNEVVGIIEIASFEILEEFQIKFIETIAESTANILSSVKNRIQTEKLLFESDKQRDQLQQQEEKMRQNLEEMQATQEEFAKEQEANHNLFEAVEKSIFVVEYDLDKKMLYANRYYLELLHLEQMHLTNRYHKDNLTFIDKYTSEEGYDHFWKDLKHGKIIEVLSKVSLVEYKSKKEFFIKEKYVPLQDKSGKVEKIIKLAINVTDIIK